MAFFLSSLTNPRPTTTNPSGITSSTPQVSHEAPPLQNLSGSITKGFTKIASQLKGEDKECKDKRSKNVGAAYTTLPETDGTHRTHAFALHHFHKPVRCRVCAEHILGIGLQGFKCGLCKYPVHKKCLTAAPKNCHPATKTSIPAVQPRVTPPPASPSATPQPPSPVVTPAGSATPSNSIATSSSSFVAPPSPVAPQHEAKREGSNNTESERLRQEVEALKKRIMQLECKGGDKANESELCIICFESKINTVLLECGHRAVCLLCAEKLFECPMCREKITRVIRIYDAH